MNSKYSKFFTNPGAFVTGCQLQSEGLAISHPKSITVFPDKELGYKIAATKLEEQAMELVNNKNLVIGYSVDNTKVSKMGIVTGATLLVGSVVSSIIAPEIEPVQIITGGSIVASSIITLATTVIYSLKANKIKRKNEQIATVLTEELGVYEIYGNPEIRKLVSKEIMKDNNDNITRELTEATIALINERKNELEQGNVEEFCDIFFIDRLVENPEDAYKILDAINRLHDLNSIVTFDYSKYPDSHSISCKGESLESQAISNNKVLKRVRTRNN